MQDDLGDRIKRYESITDNCLIPRLPAIARIDGRAFHTFCKGLRKPWDQRFHDTMVETTIALCKDIQGAQLGYTQSDEITILIIDFENLNSESWFGYRIQKMASIIASIATEAFVKGIKENIPEKYDSPMRFDARVFSVPNVQEVLNTFLFRQHDAVRNSKLSLGQSLISHRDMQGISANAVVKKVYDKYGINWDNLISQHKWGTMVIKKYYTMDAPDGTKYIRSKWEGDKETPGPDGIKEYIIANSKLEQNND